MTREDEIERIRKNSTNGNRTRKQIRKYTIDKDLFKKLVATIAVMGTLLGVGLTTGTEKLANEIKEQSAVSDVLMDYQQQYVSKHTHRTQDLRYYYYNYYDIANDLQEEPDDLDTKLYAVYEKVGKDGMDTVIGQINGSDFEKYLADHNYSDPKDWKTGVRERVATRLDAEKRQAELEAMQDEHNITEPQNATKGGK